MNESQSSIFSLDSRCSTTRMVTNERPKIENIPSSKVQTELFLPVHSQRQGEGGLRMKGYFKKSFNDKPLVSIITVVFNRHEYLEHTIQSVLNQTYDNVEYIVIDGGSTDGTVDIIRKYEQVIDYWVSEPDSGIADAWNKGILASTGDIISLINSDDWYELNAVTEVAGLFVQNRAAGVIHGNKRQWNESGTMVLGVARPTMRTGKVVPFRSPVNHPTCFVHKQIYQTYGLFDKSYKVGMDYEFMLRLCGHKVSVTVPLLNEEANINPLYQQLTQVLDGKYDYEIIFVDDGSTDGSFKTLAQLQKSDARVHVISFRRNFGQTAALSAGFTHARGDIIVAIDADLQNDPTDIPAMIERLEEGFDVVSGWRKKKTRQGAIQAASFQNCQLGDFQNYGRKTPRFRLYSQSLPQRSLDPDKIVRRNAPLHSGAGKLERRKNNGTGHQTQTSYYWCCQIRPRQNLESRS